MQIETTIKEALPLLDKNIISLEEKLSSEKEKIKKSILARDKYFSGIETSLQKVNNLNFQKLIERFTYTRSEPATRKVWLFFEEYRISGIFG